MPDEPMPDANEQQLTPPEGSHRGNKRRRTDDDDVPAEAKRLRALTIRKDDSHLAIETFFDEKATAATISALHLAIRCTQPVPGFTVAPIKRFEFKPRALLVSHLLAYNSARAAWQHVAEIAQGKDKAKCMLVIPLGWTYKKDELAAMSGLITRATHTILQIKGASVIPPQASQSTNDICPRMHDPPHPFLLNGLSIESRRDAASGCFYCLRDDEGKTHALAYIEYDLAPKTHVRTLRGLDTVPDDKPARVQELTDHVVAHVGGRRDKVEYVADALAAHYWGKSLPKNWFDILLASIYVEILIDEAGGNHKRSVHVNVYGLGLFTEHDACEKWSEALLGDEVSFGVYGFGKALRKPFICSYCHETDHHVRLCRILKHPLWFHKPDLKVDYTIPDEGDDDWKRQKPKHKPGKGGNGKGKGKGKGKA